MKKGHLNPTAAGLAVGLLWGVALLVWTLVATKNGYGAGILNLLAEVYPGYGLTSQGAVLGLVYGFLDGFIGCFVMVWLYNWFVDKIGK